MTQPTQLEAMHRKLIGVFNGLAAKARADGSAPELPGPVPTCNGVPILTLDDMKMLATNVARKLAKE